MKLEHSFSVPAPVDATWAAFNELERVVPCFPGATLTSYDGEGFAGSVKVKVGPVALQYAGNGTFVDRDPANHRAVVEAKGKDRRGNGTATARVTARLAPEGASGTAVSVETELTVTGRPAQFGRGLMQEISDKLLDQFVACLAERLGGPATEKAERTAGVSPDAPQQTAFAPSATTAGSARRTSVTSQRAESDWPHPNGEVSEEPAPAPDVELDLGAAVVPVLARRIAPYLIGAAVALILRRFFVRKAG
ncbi:carbon monoxide dehydrogenase subunit G [Kribbella amoyensis]|uniref:Carbon monoxide dehydrogenase subunit G n=1 Tax=Kribbella amoyensis TaxID=996641 RepID=A0A561BWX2_9ACTN|nr:SRPBCC family protein [Kribbella amoyensis]TWD83328.1 carbon monoxide dehydrogenase subunit G [Kribbella amoyensis]